MLTCLCEDQSGLSATSAMVMRLPQLNLSDIVQWRNSPVETEVDREIVLLSLERGRCYALGETGSAVWRKLAAPIRIEELCRQLSNEYFADVAVLTNDVLELLEQLRHEGLLEVVS